MGRFIGAFAHSLALSLGAGLSPMWPGTVGAVVGLAVALPFALSGILAKLAMLAVLFAVGVWASAYVARLRGIDDPQEVVIDETFGAAAVVLFLPAGLLWWIAGFLAFRFFDINKTWPVNRLQDEVKGGLGIMLDDAGAALWSLAVLVPLAWALGAYP
uniref:phosphatidylglycerophosphatase A family protein n=1 Tax=Stappia sp. TaxID=1870903 RepID=UPI003BAD7EC9